ncbi:MAG: carbohydrate kinase [Gammaproteobacteria bacterium]|nr:carbohydrate kinase [Gammaproteobacteria bacterium]
MFLVCGEALLDLFIEDSDDSGGVKFDARVGGSPFNVAIGLARLDVPVALLTGISNDLPGEQLNSVLVKEGVSIEYLIRNGRRTTLSLVGLDKAGSPSYSFYGIGSADCSIKYEHFPEIDGKLTGLHFGSYSTVIEPVATAFKKLAGDKSSEFISYDPNIRPTIEPDIDIWRSGVDEFCRYADLIKISAEDYDLLYPGKSQDEMAQHWFDLGAKLIVITNGGKQIRAWSRAGYELQITPPGLSVVDTVGAGDSFQAAILKCLLSLDKPKESMGYLEESHLYRILNYAAVAAALTCTRRGADLSRPEEIDSMINNL